MKRLLIVEDDPHVADLAAQVAGRQGFDVAFAQTYDHVSHRVLSFGPTLILLDLQLSDSGSEGVEILRLLADLGCGADVVLMSGADRRVVSAAESLGKAYGLHVRGILLKPFELADLRAHLETTSQFEPLDDSVETSPEEELHRAIRNQELALYYQPKLEVRSGKVVGAEALARWRHPKKGMIPPSEFIALAETTGLIVPLTEWALAEALRQAKDWRKFGLNMEVSVNISPGILGDASFPEALGELLKEHGVSGSCLNLEVTESGAMHNVVSAMDVLTRLRLKGISLSIDDFGTGYSSLAKLQKLPFTELKIDRSFVQNAHRDEDSRTITQAIVELGRSLKMTVVAEGVENRQVWDLLAQFRCDVAQGYLVARPMPPAAFTEWLAKREPEALCTAAGAVG
ncbi:MAG: EAL domain-containing response regulator [Desulfuromonadales bacterium]|nr:EAL domain-containing response regulator [Desulfuromonadales bacterium]NIS40893.1 EAL domain-containing response regulator [Desulfuromonadales bacterium]